MYDSLGLGLSFFILFLIYKVRLTNSNLIIKWMVGDPFRSIINLFLRYKDFIFNGG
jgi:hypothetical protein